MQHLFLLRGPQGSGKSTFIQRNGLTPWALSLDSLRTLVGSTIMRDDGRMNISNAHEDYVFHLFWKVLGERMKEGQTTFIDATHYDSQFKRYQQLATQWGYAVHIIEFGLDMTLPELMERIHQRVRQQPETFVPLPDVERFFNKLSSRPVPEGMTSLTPEQALSMISWAAVESIDDYESVLFIGDIQGCADPLRELLQTHWSDDRLFIFVGDLFDRGLQNGEVLALITPLLDKPNVRFICGNHERHILSWLHKRYVPNEFRLNTLPQLLEHGFNRDLAQKMVNRFENLVQVRMGDAYFQVSHGGMPQVVDAPMLFPGHQCWRGTGYFTHDVDTSFEHYAPTHWYQVHGHRNSRLRDLTADQRSFNLEGGVEFGGELRALLYNGAAFTPIKLTNGVFKGMITRTLYDTAGLPEWILSARQQHMSEADFADQGLISEADLAQLREHDLVRESVQELEHLSSFNFTRDAFYSQAYDACNTRARGLFINTQTREVVIRGYDKYFNINERGIPSARLEHILATTQPPYVTSIKENGSLGLLGYDAQTDSLIYASKSTISGDHALWLREQITAMLSATQLLALKALLRDCQLCLTFELIEPANDPHIIEYQAPTLILLDGVRRSMAFETVSYKTLGQIGKRFGFDVKAQGPFIQSKEQLEGMLLRISREDFKHKNQYIEGLVLTDPSGAMFKIKLPYYNLWKMARSAAQAVRRHHAKGAPIKPHHFEEPTISAFIGWLLTQPVEWADKDVITLRKAFLAAHPQYSDTLTNRFALTKATQPSP